MMDASLCLFGRIDLDDLAAVVGQVQRQFAVGISQEVVALCGAANFKHELRLRA